MNPNMTDVFESDNRTGDIAVTMVTPEPDTWTATNHIWIYTSPVILAFGICGNILTIVVMCQARMRGTSTSVYLSVLAAADMTVVVVGLLPEWLSQLHVVDLWNVHPWLCKIELYLYYTALDFAIWVLVAFSCDRFIAVCLPLKKRVYCTVERARIVCLSVLALAHLNLHVFWTRGAAYNVGSQTVENCRYLPGYVSFELSIRPPIVFVAAFLVPCVVLIVWNSMIVVRVMSAKNMRKASIQSSLHQSTAKKRMRRGLTQTTAMCVSTCVAFVVLVLPNIVLFIGKKWWHTPDNDSYRIAKAVSGQLVYLHHSINFVLYSLIGSRFRRELSILCKCTRPSVLFGGLRQLSYNTSERGARLRSRFSSNSKSPSPRTSNIPKMTDKTVRFSHLQNNEIALETIAECSR